MAIKNEEIKIRLSKEQKDLIKEVSKQQEITMSAFILKYIEPIAATKKDNFKSKSIIENRIEKTEKKIQNLKGNMLKGKNQKSKIKNLFKKFIFFK